jgi:hypothetical protein
MIRRLIALFSSLGLAALLLVYLLVLTFLGTLEQQEIGLYEAQRKYFDSWFVRFPWPGGQFAMAMLAVNLIVGGVIRLRWRWSRAGILITHFGILLLLAAGWVKLAMSSDGFLKLEEGERSDRFTSYYEWELAVGVRAADGSSRELVWDGDELAGRRGDAVVTLAAAELPFTLEVARFARNAMPRQHAPQMHGAARAAAPIVDGFWLEPLPLHEIAETNVAGCYARLRWRDGREPADTILYGGEGLRPWTQFDGDAEYQIQLRRRTWQLPFVIQLEDFEMDWHPGTDKPRFFRSDVVKIDGDDVRPVRIQMNEPLRDRGYVFFQSNWGPQDGRPGRPYSVFSVVRNPSDKWPEIACWILAIGMLIHFFGKLVGHVLRESRRLALTEAP